VYDMRYAQEEISLGNWPFIRRADGEPVPGISGTGESMKISGLTASDVYYFAVNTKDEIGNESKFSNVVSTTTIALPIPPPPPEEVPEEIPPPPKEEIVKEEKPEEKTPPPSPPPQALPPPVIFETDLIRAKGDDKVYLIKNNKKIWIPTAFAFNAAGYDWGKIKEVEPAKSVSITEAVLVRAEGRPEVYIIKGDTKRHIPNADAFNAYGYKWQDIVETRASVIGGYKMDSRFVRSIEDFKIFLSLWITDLEKSFAARQALLISPYGIDVKIYLRAWIKELQDKFLLLDNENSAFYKEIRGAVKRGDVEFCMETKRIGQDAGGIELCLNTKYYGGGGLDTLFKATEERLL